jgi:hypothetical protein
VVETDSATWLRLATGMTAWEEAAAQCKVSASVNRADLSPHLRLRPALG